MLRLMLIPAIVVFLSGCGNGSGGSSASASHTYEGVGVVKAISESKAHINVDHEAIEGFMDAMQMFFPVLDSSVVSKVEVADSIRFEILVENGNYAISSIEVIE